MAACGDRPLERPRLRLFRARRKGERRVLRRGRPHHALRLAGARDRLAGFPRLPGPRLCDGGGPARPRLCLRNNRDQNAGQLHRPGKRGFGARGRTARRAARRHDHAPRASRPRSTGIPTPFTNARKRDEHGSKDQTGAAAAPRSARSTASSWPTSARRATAASSSRSAPTIRCSPKRKRRARDADLERIQHWLSKGAQPTDRVLRFLDKAGVPSAKRAPTRRKPSRARRRRNAPRQSSRRKRLRPRRPRVPRSR